jgi:MFS family permease
VAPQGGFLDVAAVLWRNVTFRHLLLCFSVMNFFGSGILQWQPAFLIRSYGIKTGQLGTWFALIYGLGGLAGTYWGGELATRRAAGNEHRQLAVMALVYVAFGLISACIYLSTHLYWALIFIVIAVVGGATTSGPLFATIQTLVPAPMRATSIATIYLFANLIGAGLGPLASGALSDWLRPRFGAESLRYALLLLTPGYFWGAWHVWRASKTVMRDLPAA